MEVSDISSVEENFIHGLKWNINNNLTVDNIDVLTVDNMGFNNDELVVITNDFFSLNNNINMMNKRVIVGLCDVACDLFLLVELHSHDGETVDFHLKITLEFLRLSIMVGSEFYHRGVKLGFVGSDLLFVLCVPGLPFSNDLYKSFDFLLLLKLGTFPGLHLEVIPFVGFDLPSFKDYYLGI